VVWDCSLRTDSPPLLGGDFRVFHSGSGESYLVVSRPCRLFAWNLASPS
jgi:hypothetical protein